MRAPVFVLSLMLVAFAGCVDDSVEESDAMQSEDPQDEGKKGGLSYEIDPDSANETELAGAHTHDEWGGTKELTLLDGSVETADCVEPMMGVAQSVFGVVTEQQVRVGCASWRLDEGVIVPEGTEWLRVEVDASDALKEGSMELMYANDEAGRVQLDAADAATYTWRIPVGPLEWDLPHSTQTSWWFLLEPVGNPAILDGSVDIIVVAERLEDWKPILGSAHIDHWEQLANHTFIDTGVYTALDTNLTVEMPSYSERAGSSGEGVVTSVPFQDIVAPGAVQVTMTVQWSEVAGCPAAHECWLVSFVSPANSRQSFFAQPTEEGPNWAVYVFDSPDPMSPDSTYAEESVYYAGSYVRACPEADIPNPGSSSMFSGCMGDATSSMDADVRFRVEVWDHPADVAAARERAGIV